MSEKRQAAFPSQGWRQILTVRKEMLDTYDRAREQSRGHEVETYHGGVAEAECRRWLTDFLPKRYGVTAGHVVSPAMSDSDKMPHFDVIIYDQINSPILWIEGSADNSLAGRCRAVPVEHVYAVLEVKAALSSRTVGQAIEHLGDLMPLMQHVDDPNERYKAYLPPTFCCGCVFFELRDQDSHSQNALAEFLRGDMLRRFFGAIVLRGEGHTHPHTGRLSLTISETQDEGFLHQERGLLNGWSSCGTVPRADGMHAGCMLMWSEFGFAQFSFDLIAMMNGTYEPGRLSSFHGVGSSFA